MLELKCWISGKYINRPLIAHLTKDQVTFKYHLTSTIVNFFTFKSSPAKLVNQMVPNSQAENVFEGGGVRGGGGEIQVYTNDSLWGKFLY